MPTFRRPTCRDCAHLQVKYIYRIQGGSWFGTCAKGHYALPVDKASGIHQYFALRPILENRHPTRGISRNCHDWDPRPSDPL